MCWCTPNIRTPCCGKPECHPRDKAAARSEYWKAEHNAANTEIDALRSSVAELEAVILAAHDELMGEFWNCPICGHAETTSDMDVMECHLKAAAEKIRASKR